MIYEFIWTVVLQKQWPGPKEFHARSTASCTLIREDDEASRGDRGGARVEHKSRGRLLEHNYVLRGIAELDKAIPRATASCKETEAERRRDRQPGHHRGRRGGQHIRKGCKTLAVEGWSPGLLGDQFAVHLWRSDETQMRLCRHLFVTFVPSVSHLVPRLHSTLLPFSPFQRRASSKCRWPKTTDATVCYPWATRLVGIIFFHPPFWPETTFQNDWCEKEQSKSSCIIIVMGRHGYCSLFSLTAPTLLQDKSLPACSLLP